MRTSELIRFKTLGLKIDDKIRFISSGDLFRVGGGIMIQNPSPGGGLYSITLMTRLLLNVERLPEDFDVYKRWEYKGKTLRDINEGRKRLARLLH